MLQVRNTRYEPLLIYTSVVGNFRPLATMCYQGYGFKRCLSVHSLFYFYLFLEHVSALTVPVKDELNLGVGDAVGLSIVGLVHCLVQNV